MREQRLLEAQLELIAQAKSFLLKITNVAGDPVPEAETSLLREPTLSMCDCTDCASQRLAIYLDPNEPNSRRF